MCNPALLLVGAGLSAGSAIGGGMAAKGAADADARMAGIQAGHEREAGLQAADKTRRRGELASGEARGVYAASGIKVDSGSAAFTQREIDQASEQDALALLINSQRRAVATELQGRMSRIAGKNAKYEGYMKGAGSLLQGGYQYSQWSGGSTLPTTGDFSRMDRGQR